jgi:TolB-like protein/class 3 adenylate cyclase
MDGPERRLAAILSADAVGYSRLMAADEAATIRAITASRELIGGLAGEHRGRVVDAPGDNVLVEFPTALDAVTCAVAIQRGLEARNADLPDAQRMHFRIGVHLGDIASEGGKLYGTGVNVAARLEALAEPGGICLSSEVHGQVEGKLDLAYEDLGAQAVKNIPTPVRVYGVAPGGSRSRKRRSRPRTFLAVAGGLLLLVATALWLSWPAPIGLVLDLTGMGSLPTNPELPDGPSLVVLPFDNLSDDPAQAYFADGITEDLTTDLARSSKLFVIARNTAFTYKGKTFDVQDVGRELGVRYALEGSVRKARERVRINAQLIDAGTGHHLWSERYDGELADVFGLQDQIVLAIFDAVGATIGEEEYDRARRKPPEDLSAYDAYMRAMSHFREDTAKGNLEARAWLERAIELDPNYTSAHSLLAATYGKEYGMGWNTDPTLVARRDDALRRCLELDPTNPECNIALAAQLRDLSPEDALRRTERAVELAPNNPSAHMFHGAALLRAGQPLTAMAALRRAVQLNPRGVIERGTVAVANLRAGRTREAVEILEENRALRTDSLPARLMLANHYEGIGEHARARELVEEVLEVNPDLTVAHLAIVGPAAVMQPGYLATMEKNLRAAGLPD